MKKLFTLITFGAGAVFGMLFSTKEGGNVRRKMNQKKSTEEKAEVVAEEAKQMAKNFWNTIKGPLNKASQAVKKDIERYADEYSGEAKKKIDTWKKKAEKEIEKDVKKAKSELKKATKKISKKASSTVKKKASQAKKTVKKKLKK